MRTLVAALVAVAAGTVASAQNPTSPYDFGEVARADYRGLPKPGTIPARDGTPLAVRVYPSEAKVAVLAIHGSSGEGSYYHPLARRLAADGRASVYVLDLRGHGESGGRRGDVDYIGQLEDDVADVLAAMRQRHPGAKLVLAGHSAGGGLAVRYAGRTRSAGVDGYILLAPYLGPDAPTSRPAAGGWAVVDVPKIAELAEKATRNHCAGRSTSSRTASG